MVELPARENPVKATRRRYYTPYEEHQGALVEPLVKCAGTDISRWFTEDGNLKTHVCPATDLTRPYCPQGRFVHVPPAEPVANWATNFAVPWWQNAKLRIGYLSKRTRMVRIKNVLTEQEDVVEVPGEETLAEIRERYLELNWHAPSYTWKALVHQAVTDTWDFQELDMNKTLLENGISDEAPEFEDLSIQVAHHIPVLHVYWNDDLTVA